MFNSNAPEQPQTEYWSDCKFVLWERSQSGFPIQQFFVMRVLGLLKQSFHKQYYFNFTIRLVSTRVKLISILVIFNLILSFAVFYFVSLRNLSGSEDLLKSWQKKDVLITL